MRSPQLRYRIVAIADQHAVIKSAGFFKRGAIVAGRSLRSQQILQSQLRVAEKFVEEGAPQTLCGAAITRKQSARDFLRQLQTENRSIEISKKRGERPLLLASKLS